MGSNSAVSLGRNVLIEKCEEGKQEMKSEDVERFALAMHGSIKGL